MNDYRARLFQVHGKVKGKERPRFGNGKTYTPKATSQYEKTIKYAYRSTIGDKIDGNIVIMINSYRKVPKNYPKYKLKELPRVSDKKPDVDNIAKVVLDALNGLAYEDDKQVSELTIQKYDACEEYIDVEIVCEDGD